METAYAAETRADIECDAEVATHFVMVRMS